MRPTGPRPPAPAEALLWGGSEGLQELQKGGSTLHLCTVHRSGGHVWAQQQVVRLQAVHGAPPEPQELSGRGAPSLTQTHTYTHTHSKGMLWPRSTWQEASSGDEVLEGRTTETSGRPIGRGSQGPSQVQGRAPPGGLGQPPGLHGGVVRGHLWGGGVSAQTVPLYCWLVFNFYRMKKYPFIIGKNDHLKKVWPDCKPTIMEKIKIIKKKEKDWPEGGGPGRRAGWTPTTPTSGLPRSGDGDWAARAPVCPTLRGQWQDPSPAGPAQSRRLLLCSSAATHTNGGSDGAGVHPPITERPWVH